jgi:hypothetical protein
MTHSCSAAHLQLAQVVCGLQEPLCRVAQLLAQHANIALSGGARVLRGE